MQSSFLSSSILVLDELKFERVDDANVPTALIRAQRHRMATLRIN